jgi:DeoR/GlpR family transcriptional regulator of sugar metabolism
MKFDGVDLAGARRARIEELVRERGAVSVQELCEEFEKSEATIRRDLLELANKGSVTRTHGGVMINSHVIYDLPNDKRKSIGADEKRRIADAAIEMLTGDEVVFLDAGTTALAVAEQAQRKPDCHYVTTSLGVARRLKAQKIENFFLVGGSYNGINDSFVGTLAIAAIRSLSFDISFLCCSSINVSRKSIGLHDHAYSQTQKEAISASRLNYVIADDTKFQATALIWTAEFRELDGIITNRELDDSIAAQLKEQKMEVVLT